MLKKKWDKRFLSLAKEISLYSKDPSTKVGSIIVDQDKRIISSGYNGFPKGVNDSEERYNNKESKYSLIIHAEENALLFAQRPLNGCTIYTYPFMPCTSCTGLIIQTGIKRIVAPNYKPERWLKNFEFAAEIMKEANIELELING